MRKLDQEISANETISFPSCKTFVFLRSEYPVSFKFITLFNRIDRTIENFQDSFSVTADTYFLRVEISSKYSQTLSCILIEDTKIEYTPITGDVFISNDDAHRVPTYSYNVNSREYPIPVYSHKGVLTNLKINHDKYYKGYYNERFKACCYVPSQNASSNLECYCIFPKVNRLDNNPIYQKAYLTSLHVYPESDNFLEIWLKTGGSGTHGYNSYISQMYNIDGKTKVYSGYQSDTDCWVKYKNIARNDLVNESNEFLLFSFPLKSNTLFSMPIEKPICLDCYNSAGDATLSDFLTITTRSNCHINLNITIELFEDGFFTNQTYNPKES